MKWLVGIYLFTFSFSFATGTGHAEERAKDRTTSCGAIQFGATPNFLFLDNMCGADGDKVGCANGMYTWGFQVDGNYRFPFAWFALGIVGGANFEQKKACPSSDGCVPVELEGILLWRVALETRFYPFIGRRMELWLALEGGVVGAAKGAVSDVGGDTGLGLGLDFPIGSHFVIGLDLRALFFGFGIKSETYQDDRPVKMSNTFWTSVGFLKLGGRFSL